MQIERQIAHAGFIQIIFGLVRIKRDLRQVGCIILIGRADRVVIANGAMPQQNLVNNLLTVAGIFDGQTHIHIIERLVIHQHRKGVVHIAGDFDDLNIRVCFHQRHCLKINPVYRVNLTGHDGVHAGR